MNPRRAAGFRTFTLIWATQSLSALGTAITYFAISIWLAQVVYPAPADRHPLAAALSALGVAYVLPLLLALLAGAWADRHDRRGTMAFANVASGVVVPVMFAHSQSIWQAQVPAETQGRVFSTRSLLARVTTPLSAALAGWAAACSTPASRLPSSGFSTPVSWRCSCWTRPCAGSRTTPGWKAWRWRRGERRADLLQRDGWRAEVGLPTGSPCHR